MISGLGRKRRMCTSRTLLSAVPPENRHPLPAEIEAYKPYLTRQIEVIDPKLIVTLRAFLYELFFAGSKDHSRSRQAVTCRGPPLGRNGSSIPAPVRQMFQDSGVIPIDSPQGTRVE